MKKLSLLSTLMLFVIAAMLPMNLKAQVSVWDGTYAPWTNGTGTEADPFLIENAQQLAYLANRVNNGLDAAGGHISNHDLYYKLMTDVNLNGSEDFQWTPIGYWISNTNNYSFGGHFDGNNHTISGLYINSSANRVGFFGYTDGATIMNLSVSGDTVATTLLGVYVGGVCAGGIVGYATVTQIKNCSNSCNITTNCSDDNSYTGGIVGYNICNSSISMSITDCYNIGNIISTVSSHTSSTGGIVGRTVNDDYATMTITNSYNVGNIISLNSNSTLNGAFSYSGGIAGAVENSDYATMTITNSYNVGDISSSLNNTRSFSGGIVAYTNGTSTFTNNYNTGNVTSSYYSGGIVGYAIGVSITNSYNTGDITSTNSSGGIIGGVSGIIENCYYRDNCGGHNTYGGLPMSSDNMQTQEFLGILNNGTCAFEMDAVPNTNQGYPVLTMLVLLANTLNATSVTQTHATLNGILTVKNDSIVGFGFKYKEEAEVAYTYVPCFAFNDTVNTTITGLRPSTNYIYGIYMLSASCDTTFGNEKTITTLAVGGVSTNPATDLTESSATLNGTLNMGDATITSRGFEYRAVGDTNYTTVLSSDSTHEFSAPLYGLTVNTIYEYRAFVNIAENTETYYGTTRTFEVSWLNADTIYIYDADMLRWVSDRCNSGTTFEGKYIKLMNNIVLPLNQPNNMTSIGVYPSYPFKGTFDGNGLTINNLYIDQPNTPYQGFFGYTQNANLYEVGLVNITASGRNYTGGMVAYAQNTYMRDCYVNGGSLFALSYCGGLVGYQSSGTNSIISGCYNTCTVSGNHYVGGLVGYSDYATVRNSYVAASVTGQGDAIGAIIGGANEVLMYNCYFSSSITGQSSAIGENNFKDDEGLSDEEMRDPAFVATLNQGLVRPVWKSDYAAPINNGFPILIWQYSDAEACEGPENLIATISGNSALLSWAGGDNANYFIVEYGMVGETPQQENTPNNQFTIHNVQEGTYFWRVKSVCSFGESNFVNGENITTGIATYDGSDLILYPNPTTGFVNVQCSMDNAQLGDVEIQVFDVYGRRLSVETKCIASPQTTQIDLSNYATGIYIIKLVNGGRVVATGKVVKE